jgi:hypothetical protein
MQKILTESNKKGHTPLFDSLYRPKSISTDSVQTATPHTNATPQQRAADSQKRRVTGERMEIMSEMIFGAIPLAQSVSSTTKIHLLRSHNQILISKLFCHRFELSTLLPHLSSSKVTVISILVLKWKQSAVPWKQMFAIGVIFNAEDNTFIKDLIFSHFALIEYRIRELQRALKNSLSAFYISQAKKKQQTIFHQLSLQEDSNLKTAVLQFKDAVFKLLTFPHLNKHVWLDILSFPLHKLNTIVYFLQEFQKVLNLETSKNN